MPKLKQPPQRKRKTNPKGEPPNDRAVVTPLTKRPSSEPVPLNFTVENEFRREFKVFAVTHDMNMVDLLKQSFELYKQQARV